MSKHKFQTEVNDLLDLMIHSLYSHKEIFLRELISNASDALDKLRFLTLSDDAYKGVNFEPKIEISFDEDTRKTLTISDTGIGMNEQDLIENLGTIAKSGTKNFVKALSGDKKKDSNLIGQFGVGFYSSFMVADKIEVVSKKANEQDAYSWISDAKGEFEIKKTQKDSHGTTIILHLNEENGKEFANRWTLESIIKKYSNHIPFPIFLEFTDQDYDKDGKETSKTLKNEQINSASSLWRKQKSSLKAQDYIDFYKTISHDSEDPLAYVHTQAEGTLEYATLFYIPKKAPFDIFRVDYEPNVKLYVNRVFITDDDKELLPTYLRFVKGIIDSSDLPLNVSREILQHNKILSTIKAASVKKILDEIENLSKDTEKYKIFWKEYSRLIKEGIYQDYANKEKLLELARFKSLNSQELISLKDYKAAMKPDQKSIYYIIGENESVLRRSPLLEKYKAQNIDVLIFDEEIDDIVVPSIHEYDKTPLKSLNVGADELSQAVSKEQEEELKPLIEKIKTALADEIKEVKISTRLSDSPSCVVVDDNDPSFQMQQMLKAMGQGENQEFKPVLEINPSHPILKALENIQDLEEIKDISRLLLDQALLIEGKALKDPIVFAKTLNKIMQKSL